MLDLQRMRKIYEKQTAKKATIYPTVTQDTYHRFRDDFIRNHVGGDGPNTWGAQSVVGEMSLLLLMAVVTGEGIESIADDITKAIPDPFDRGRVVSHLNQVAKLISDAFAL